MMQSFTKNEITWMIDLLSEKITLMDELKRSDSASNAERALYNLRAEQMIVMCEKLRKVVDNGNKRIEIKY